MIFLFSWSWGLSNTHTYMCTSSQPQTHITSAGKVQTGRKFLLFRPLLCVCVRVCDRKQQNNESPLFVTVVFDKLKWMNTQIHMHTHLHSIWLLRTHLWGQIFPTRPSPDIDHLWHQRFPHPSPLLQKVTEIFTICLAMLVHRSLTLFDQSTSLLE